MNTLYCWVVVVVRAGAVITVGVLELRPDHHVFCEINTTLVG